MRVFIPNVITPDEAEALTALPKKKCYNSEHPVVKKVRAVIDSKINTDWSPPAYSRVERGKKHKWHVDTGGAKGSTGHMSWCSYGCSVLLTDDKDAGFLEYRDGHKLLPEEHYCGLAIHSSDVEHQVSQGGPSRITLLFFTQ